jgi:hypothetical protein
MWENKVERGRPQITICDAEKTPLACRLTKATDIHSKYVIFIAFFTPAVVTRTRLNVTLYVHCPSCYAFFTKEKKKSPVEMTSICDLISTVTNPSLGL